VPANTLKIDDVRHDLQKLLDAFDMISQHYPHHEVQLVPRDVGGNGQDDKMLDDLFGPSFTAGTNKERVLQAAAGGKWFTPPQIEEMTGLEKKQVYGVLTAPEVKDRFDREEIGGGPAKRYRLKEE